MGSCGHETGDCGHGLGRRDFLNLAGAGIGAGLIGTAASAQRRQAPHAGKGLIDVHHHIRPPEAPEGFARMTAHWSPEGAIADMDRTGVATGIAYPGPILAGDAAAKAARARMWNEFAADLASRHPGRFGLFASLPFPFVDAALAEIDHACDRLNADGFGLATSYGDHFLGSEHFWPVYEQLNRRKAVLFIHPHDALCCAPADMSYLKPGMDGSWIDWPMNTARTIFSLMTTGTLRRFPDIRWIFSHGGGVMPLLVRRLADFTAWGEVGPEKLGQLFPNGIEAEFRSLYFEGAQAWAAPNIRALRALVADEHILFGSDYPFFPLDHAAKGFREAEIPDAHRHLVGGDNARMLLPRWR